MRDWQCCSPWRVKWLSCEDTRLPKKVSLLIGFLYFYRNSRASQEMYLDPCTNCFLAQLTTKKRNNKPDSDTTGTTGHKLWDESQP